MIMNIKKRIEKIICSKKSKRVVSGLTAFVMLFGYLPLSDIVTELDNADMPSIIAFADDNDLDYTHASETNMTVLVPLAELARYSLECKNNRDYHKNDQLIIQVGDNSVSFTLGFEPLGDEDHPFEGSVAIEGNSDIVLNLDAPLFNVVKDSVKLNNGNVLKISREYDPVRKSDTTTPVLANKVVKGSGASAEWNVNICRPSANSSNGGADDTTVLGEFGGLIGTMVKNNAGSASLKLNVTMNTDGVDTTPARISGNNNTGFICGYMMENTSLDVTIDSTRGVGNIITASGNVGGLVGKAESGAALTYTSGNLQSASAEIRTDSEGYAGGLIGENLGATLDLGESNYTIAQKIEGTKGTGAVYGYYKSDSSTFSASKYDITSNCQVNGVGAVGGLFGVLESSADLSIASNIITANHASKSALALGGIAGKYKADGIHTLTISSVQTTTTNTGGATIQGGAIGEIEGDAYVSIDGFTTTATKPDLTYGGLVGKAPSSFIDAKDVKVTTASSFKGGGLVGNLDHGVLQMKGKIDLSAATPAAPESGENSKIGQIVGWRDDSLVFAAPGWKLVRCPAAEMDDIGSWGEVVRFDGYTVDDTTVVPIAFDDLFTIGNDHVVTINAPEVDYTSITNAADYAKTALCFQIDASDNPFVKFDKPTFTYDTIKDADITLKSDIVLKGTGFGPLTRDNDISSDGSGAKCIYSGSFSGKTTDTSTTPATDTIHTVTLSIGETYGYRGNDTTPALSTQHGAGRIYRHAYSGLFAITNKESGVTASDVIIDGTIDTKANDSMYIGSVAGLAKTSFSVSNVTVNTAFRHNGGSKLSLGGVLGEAADGIGAISVQNCTINANITGGASSDTALCLGGVIGKIADTKNVDKTWTFNDIDVSGTISNDSSLSANRVGGLVAVITGFGDAASNRTLALQDIQINDLGISVNAASDGSVGGLLGYSWLNVNADFNNVNIGKVVTTEDEPPVTTVTTPSITQTNDSATGVDLAGLVYNGTGYWTINTHTEKDEDEQDVTVSDLSINAFKLSSDNAESFGMIVNKAWSGEEEISSALYLEMQHADAYDITADNVSFKKHSASGSDMTIPIFDEFAAYTAFYTGEGASKVGYANGDPDDLYILRNRNSVISIETGNPNGGLIMYGSSPSGTYTPATSYGKQPNPYSRYYYNLYTIKSGTSKADWLMGWGARWYAHSSIQSNVSASNGTTVGTSGDNFDMRGYSWYPLNIDSSSVTLNGTFTLYNAEFESSETEAQTADSTHHAARTSRFDLTQYNLTGYGTTQHYLMQNALFNNVRGKLTANVSLKGNVALIDTSRNVTVSGKSTEIGKKYCGALVMGTVAGSAATDAGTATVTITKAELDGICVSNLVTGNSETAYAPLLINRTDSFTKLDVSNVYVASTASYDTTENENVKTDSGSNPKAATSLIGDAGSSSSSKNVNLAFKNIYLDGRKENLSLTALDSKYHTSVSIFTKATFLNRYARETGRGTYNFAYAEDWKETKTSADGDEPETFSYSHTPLNVTYGKELGYTSADTATEFPGQENYYSDQYKSFFVDPSTGNNTSAVYANYKNKFLPYVAVGYTSSCHQIEVNHTTSSFGGCGTYNDPYTITAGKDFETIYNILYSETQGNDQKIYLPLNSTGDSVAVTGTGKNAVITGTWETAKGHAEFIYKAKHTDNSGEEPVEYPAGYYRYVSDNDKYFVENTNGKIDNYLTVEQVRTYVAGAYYLLDPASDNKIVLDPTASVSSADYVKNFNGLGNTLNNDTYAIFRGVIVGSGIEKIENKTGYPLIAKSNGSVVKDCSIVVNCDTTKAMSTATAYDNGGVSYGAVIGTVLGGDNIIDGVTVEFEEGTKITLSGNAAQLIPVGGYVGVVLNGGVIFRGMDDITDGISGIPEGVVTAAKTPGVGDTSLGDMVSETNMRWLYVNPIIGRVINGYAVTESDAYRPFEDGTRVYHGGARTLINETTNEEYEDPDGLVTKYWDETNQTEVTTAPASLSHVTMRNGNKNYSIADINPDETNMLDAKTGNVIDVPNGQAFFVMSLIVNSGAGIQKGKNDAGLTTNKLGYYTGYYTLRHADYDEVGNSTSDDYDYYASKDNYYGKLSNDNDKKFNYTPYLIETYTKSYTESVSNTNRVIYYAKTIGYVSGWTINLTGNTNYYLPDGYKGLGNIYANNDYSRLNISTFNGNNKKISQNTSFYNYFTKSGNNSNLFDTYYTPPANVGLGLINYQNLALTASELTLSGNVVSDAIDQTSSKGEHVPYFGSNSDWSGADKGEGIDRPQMLNAGSLIGRTEAILNLTDILLDNVNVRGLKTAGGLIGCSTNNKITITVNNDCDKIKIHSAGNTGGLIGRKTVGAATIDFNNHYFNITEVIGESTGYGDATYDANYSVGGLIGGARCDANGSDSSYKTYILRNINMGNPNRSNPVTIKCENGEFFTGGLVGTATRTALVIDNCHIYNLDLTSKYYAGGLLGQIATVPNADRNNANKSTDTTYITNCSIEKNPSSSYGSIVSTGNAAGGFIGAGKNDLYSDVIMQNCYIKGITVSSSKYTGGVAGNWGLIANGDGKTYTSSLVLQNFSISDCTLKGDDSVGGLVGILNRQHQYVDGKNWSNNNYNSSLKGYNILAKNLAFEPYTENETIGYKGYICGYNEKFIQLAGFSRQDDRKNDENKMIAELVGNGGFGTNGYVVFADYNDNASDTDTNKLFSNIGDKFSVVTDTNVDSMRSKIIRNVTTTVSETEKDDVVTVTPEQTIYSTYNSEATAAGTNTRTVITKEKIYYSGGKWKIDTTVTTNGVEGTPTTGATLPADRSALYTDQNQTTTIITTDVITNENYPYVTSNPKNDDINFGNTTDGKKVYLTGDGISSYSYTNSTAYSIISDNTNKRYTNWDYLTGVTRTDIQKHYSNAATEFNNYSGTGNFPLFVVDDTNTTNTTNLLNSYLNLLANTDFNYADTSEEKRAIYNVELYKCRFDTTNKYFIVSKDTADSKVCLQKTQDSSNKYVFKMEAENVDTDTVPQFTLMDIQFYDPSNPPQYKNGAITAGTGKIAYHLYVPIYVKKILQFDFNASIVSNTEYDPSVYPSTATRLFENLGNPVTIKLEYDYKRSPAEWAEAINSGDSVLTNYSKALTINRHNKSWPTGSKLALVDASNIDKVYYVNDPQTVFPDSSTDFQFSSFTDTGDSSGTAYTPAPLQNIMRFKAVKNASGSLMVATAADVAANKATVKIGNVYYRPITSSDTVDAADKYLIMADVSVSENTKGDLVEVTGNEIASATVFDGTKYYRRVTGSEDTTGKTLYKAEEFEPERYYLSIFTQKNTTDQNIYQFELHSKDSFNKKDINDTWWRPNKRTSDVSVRLFLGNLYENIVTLNVTPMKLGTQVMDENNYSLNVKMTATVKLTQYAKDAEIYKNMEYTYDQANGEYNASIYQSFLMTYDMLKEGAAQSNMGFVMSAGGSVANKKYYMARGEHSSDYVFSESQSIMAPKNEDDVVEGKVYADDYKIDPDNPSFMELKNNQNLIEYLIDNNGNSQYGNNDYAVTLQADYNIVYSYKNLSDQFPQKTSNRDIGTKVICYSNIASSSNGTAYSSTSQRREEIYNNVESSVRYYTTEDTKVSMSYNVVKTKTPESVDPGYQGAYAGEYSYLGINADEAVADENGVKKSFVDTYVNYDVSNLIDGGDYIELTFSLSKYGGYLQPDVGYPHGDSTVDGYVDRALPIADYITNIKIYGTDTGEVDSNGKAIKRVLYDQSKSDAQNLQQVTETIEEDATQITVVKSTTGPTLIKLRVRRDLLRTQGSADSGMYQIPISFEVFTGDDKFKNNGLTYSNYMVSVTAALYPNSESDAYAAQSYVFDDIIYTNAKVKSTVL